MARTVDLKNWPIPDIKSAETEERGGGGGGGLNEQVRSRGGWNSHGDAAATPLLCDLAVEREAERKQRQ